jgi:hypothetical protein
MKIEIDKIFSAELLPKPGNSKNSTLFVFETLKVESIPITHETQIYSFVELLSAFTSNQLHIDQEYKLKYRDSTGGYIAKIVSKKNQYFLQLIIDEKKYYYEKYECRVISKIINKILSKCTFVELTGYER